MVQGSDGDFYGTTRTGGTGSGGGNGLVFKMTPAGVLTTLVEFTGNGATNKGSSPYAALVQGSDGNFYGTTRLGGASNLGTVFKMTPAGVLTTLIEFTGNGASNKGNEPYAALVLASDGNFYGTTRAGGANNLGTVFKMTPLGVLTTLVEFTGNGATNKGRDPLAALVQGTDGNLYGTTQTGGANGAGTVFKMTPAGVLTTLVEFTGNGAANKGSEPYAALVQGSDGLFYGTTGGGGANNFGTVFKVTAAGVLTTLVEFTGNGVTNQGSLPFAALVESNDGIFYGTTLSGGAQGAGTVFKMTPGGVLTTLVELTGNGAGNKGREPYAALVYGTDGQFYGTTGYGGTDERGTIFKMTPEGVLSTLVEFSIYDSGVFNYGPHAGLVQGRDGAFYGTTVSGSSGDGTVYKMTPGGVVTGLVKFTGTAGANKGSEPYAPLTEGSDGNFYGTTRTGGAGGGGTVFKMTPSGVLRTLVEFTGNAGANKGSSPYAALVQGSDGNFYGTTFSGGANSLGTVFRMTPAGVLTTLVEFTGNGVTNKGSKPYAALVQASDGNFYGTTQLGGASNLGTAFKMTPTGILTTLVEFTGTGGAKKGGQPYAALVQGTDGNFYGTTRLGGASDFGTIFKMTPSGLLTTLVEFTGGTTGAARGSQPWAALMQASDGNFYGTTRNGGAGVASVGTVFRMTPAGTVTTLVDFSSSNNGAGGYGAINPVSSLIEAEDGHLYGTTSGATITGGTIYRIILPGKPSVLVTGVSVQASGSALIKAQVNARGAISDASLEYGTDGVAFPISVPLAVGLGGFQTASVETTLNGLSSGTTYFFRLRAVNSVGTNVSPTQSFTVLGKPLVTFTAPSEIAPASARFNGTVNARSFDTTVSFEWGTDGNSFPNEVPAVPGTVTGNTPVAVSAAVAGLTKGTQYFYRIVATNAAGTVVSGAQSFTTLTEPSAAVIGAFGLSTTSARVTGSVNANRSVTGAVFEYGTDGVSFPSSVATEPASVSGETDVAVSATLTNLSQGTTYHYRIRATSDGGVGVSAEGTFDLGVLSGFQQVAPSVLDPRPGAQGFLVVNLSPNDLTGTGWRFVGEQQWRVPGVPAGGLATGES